MRFSFVAVLLLVSVSFVHAQGTIRASSQAIPASATAPTLMSSGKDLATNGAYLTMLVLSNKDTSGHTITITDCSSPTPFLLFNGATIAAKTTWVIPMGGIQFLGCFKWSADSTQVQGSLVGGQ